MVKGTKVLGLVALGVFLCTSVVFAEGSTAQAGMGKNKRAKMTPEEMEKKHQQMMEERIAKMASELGLSAEQQTKVRDIMTATGAEAKKLMQEAQAKVKELIKGDRDKIDAVLTDEQKAKIEEKKQEREARRDADEDGPQE